MAYPEMTPSDENAVETDDALPGGKVYRSIYNVPVNVIVSIGQKRHLSRGAARGCRSAGSARVRCKT